MTPRPPAPVFSSAPVPPASPTPTPGQVPAVWLSARLPPGVDTCPACDDGAPLDQCICEEETDV